MFNKTKDTWLKVTNSILILFIVTSLAATIGFFAYDSNYYIECEDLDILRATYDTCILEEMHSYNNSRKTLYNNAALLGTSLVSLFIINFLNKKEK